VANNTSFDGDVDGEQAGGPDAPDPAQTLPGRTIAGRYLVDSVVSAGANTVVCDAVDNVDARPVTLKIVRPELAAADGFREDFESCATAVAELRHSNVATVLGWGDVDLDGVSTVFWTVEYLSGGSLRDHFDRGRFFTPSQALVVGLEAARGLEVGHRSGLVHTEVTPSKLVFGEDRRLRVIDFGFARLLGDPTWVEPSAVPTHVARYSSPEQAMGARLDGRTDIY
jgi:serine/threonine-protein kinase